MKLQCGVKFLLQKIKRMWKKLDNNVGVFSKQESEGKEKYLFFAKGELDWRLKHRAIRLSEGVMGTSSFFTSLLATEGA